MPDSNANQAARTVATPTVLVVDLVESVRLLQDADAQAIPRWERLVAQLRAEMLPRHEGRIVKSMGDGLMLTLPCARKALALARELLDACKALNQGYGGSQALQLRLAMHSTPWVEGELDIYGPGVNLCARLAGLGLPNSLVAVADAFGPEGAPSPWRIQDLGRCHLKHIDQPVHCLMLRLDPVGGTAGISLSPLRPLLAVLPIGTPGDAAPPGAADVLRDDLVRALAAAPHWQVVSRLSTQALLKPEDLGGQAARMPLWLRGELTGDGTQAMLDLSLLDGEQELWAGHFELPWTHLLNPRSELMPRIVRAIDQALLRQGTLAPLHQAALPSIPSYSLLLRAVQSLHRLRPETMLAAREMLDHLAERHPRASDVQAWLAKWHFLAYCQGLDPDRQGLSDRARQAAERALQHDAKQGVALTVQAQLQALTQRDIDRAHASLSWACDQSPNEAMAWMYLANVQALRGESGALLSYQQAQTLSPLDPLGFEIDLMGSIAHSAAGDPQQALLLAQRSIARNPLHLASQVQLMVALVECEQLAAAKAAAIAYLAQRPQASVQRFMDNHIAAGRPIVRRQADALLLAGLPL